MMNYVWVFMMLAALFTGLLTGKFDVTVTAGINSAKESIFTILGFLGIMCMWSGIMQICSDSGLSKVINAMTRPICNAIFPELRNRLVAMEAVLMNITANLLGLGNAATPLGLKAMKEMDTLNPTPSIASNSMCTFVVLNTAALQLIPSTVIALRTAAGSKNPFEIIVPIWIASIVSVVSAIIFIKILCREKR